MQSREAFFFLYILKDGETPEAVLESLSDYKRGIILYPDPDSQSCSSSGHRNYKACFISDINQYSTLVTNKQTQQLVEVAIGSYLFDDKDKGQFHKVLGGDYGAIGDKALREKKIKQDRAKANIIKTLMHNPHIVPAGIYADDETNERAIFAILEEYIASFKSKKPFDEEKNVPSEQYTHMEENDDSPETKPLIEKKKTVYDYAGIIKKLLLTDHRRDTRDIVETIIGPMLGIKSFKNLCGVHRSTLPRPLKFYKSKLRDRVVMPKVKSVCGGLPEIPDRFYKHNPPDDDCFAAFGNLIGALCILTKPALYACRGCSWATCFCLFSIIDATKTANEKYCVKQRGLAFHPQYFQEPPPKEVMEDDETDPMLRKS